MKNFFLTLALACFVIQISQATIRTVCSMPYSPGQYTTFAAAHAAAAINDTIYVHGSSLNYGAVTISKTGIVVIGAGHNPVKQAPLPSSFTSITVTSGINNCQFIGLTMQNLFLGNSTSTVVKRCKFTELVGSGLGISCSGPTNNLLVEGNVFNQWTGAGFLNINFGGNTCSNTILRNNVFSGMIISNSPSTSPLTFFITNNIFLGVVNPVFNSIINATINNNIFYRSCPQGAVTGCIMNNNISFQCASNTFSAPGANNLVGVNPQFVNFPLAGAYFDYNHDYALAAGSPGLLTSDDGTDRGVYGGFGYKFNMTGEPAMAEITLFSITSPTIIAPGGTLDITVTSKRVK
ncbi:MAG: hypothetical protein ABI723_02200 [Bacteroidia bacterium]